MKKTLVLLGHMDMQESLKLLIPKPAVFEINNGAIKIYYYFKL